MRIIAWDSKLSSCQQKEWQLICRQINNSTVYSLPRYVGKRNSAYNLIVFTDASKSLFGTVVFVKDLETLQVGFLLAKNRVVGKNLETKSIPSLELNALSLGVETAFDVKNELCSDELCNPINIAGIEIYTDSMISLNWLDGMTNKLTKSQNKLSVFVRNRLFKIQTMCEKFPITFNFIAGEENPADQVTRIVSCKQLSKSNYYHGPGFLSNVSSVPNVLSVTVPCPSFTVQSVVVNSSPVDVEHKHLLSVEKYSSFSKYLRVYSLIFKFVHKLKVKAKIKNFNAESCEPNFINMAKLHALKCDQSMYFADCVNYFKKSTCKKSSPLIIRQLNVFCDSDGLLRVRAKLNPKGLGSKSYPILLSKGSKLVDIMILSTHVRMGHTGKYSVFSRNAERCLRS